MIERNTIIHGDCLDVMKEIDDGSIDMINCDLPYGTTACSWDTIIPFEPLWEHYKRIIKPNGAIVLSGSQPFTSKLVMSNLKWFKYEWIWNKKLSSGALNANNRPLKQHENIVIFSNSKCNYNPIMRRGIMRTKGGGKKSQCYGDVEPTTSINDDYYPTSILDISNANHNNRLHPTQKPVSLYEYLIKTYTNKGDLVLDNCAGSFTTSIAAINTRRDYICIEKEKEYHDKGVQRIKEHTRQLRIF